MEGVAAAAAAAAVEGVEGAEGAEDVEGEPDSHSVRIAFCMRARPGRPRTTPRTLIELALDY